jgi:hypothetical protein
MSFALPPGWKPARIQPIERPIGLSILLFVLTCGVYGFYWTYRIHDEHPRRPGDPSGVQALLHMLLPCCVGVPLLVVCKPRPADAKVIGLLPLWWLAMLLITYANLSYAYIGWRLTGRYYDMGLYRYGQNAPRMKEGTLSLVIAISIWVLRNLLEGLHVSGVPVPEMLLHSHTQALLRGLSIGFAFKWWLGIQKEANLFSTIPNR